MISTSVSGDNVPLMRCEPCLSVIVVMRITCACFFSIYSKLTHLGGVDPPNEFPMGWIHLYDEKYLHKYMMPHGLDTTDERIVC